MLNPESVQQNETRKVLWDFKIQTDSPYLGQKTRPNERQQQKKKKERTCRIVD